MAARARARAAARARSRSPSRQDGVVRKDSNAAPESTLPQNVVWRRLAEYYESLTPNETKEGEQKTTDKPSRPLPGSGRRWRVLDLIALAIWGYWLLRIFVGDVDEAVISAINPAWLPVLEYRFAGYVLIPVAFAIAWPRGRAAFGYVLLFPLIVVLWKIPLLLFRRRSWPFLLGMLQAGTALFGDLRWNVITKGLAIVAALGILTSSRPPVISVCALYIGSLMVLSIYRRVRRLVGSPSFVTIQRRAIRGVMKSTAVTQFLTLGDEYTRHDRRGYSPQQATQVEMTISNGIMLHKLLFLWASQLERYRKRYAPAIVFHLLTYAWVYLAAILGFALLNLAVLKLSPDQYAVEGPRPFVALLVYALSTFALGSAGGVRPIAELAYALQFAAAISNLFILAGFGANVLLTVVRERDDTATSDLIDELRQAADTQERRFRGTYAVGIDEAYERLRDFGAAAIGLAAVVARAIPRSLPPLE